MTNQTFEFKSCPRWKLLRMLASAWWEKRLTLAWMPPEPEPGPKVTYTPDPQLSFNYSIPESAGSEKALV